MPEHTTFLSYLYSQFPAFRQNAKNLGFTFVGHHEATWHNFEPLFTALLVMLVLIGIAFLARTKLRDVDAAVIPDDRLTLRTFMEAFVGYFYDLTKDIMGPRRAKRYFPVVGTGACFVFFSNILTLVPGFVPPTSSLNVTLGCALVVFIMFNFYGLQKNGFAYLKHLAGPSPYLAPLLFPIELVSLCIRPFTLAARLMINMAVDHLLITIFLGLVALFVPVPLMFLGVIVVLAQTLVFSLLTAIYIGLATEHEEHA